MLKISKLKIIQPKEHIIQPKEHIIKTKSNDFNPDCFEDINGFELTIYKKNYYLRDLETNELYNIVDNKPGQIIGLLNSKGKIKFN